MGDHFILRSKVRLGACLEEREKGRKEERKKG